MRYVIYNPFYMNFSEKRISDVEVRHHPPEGTFTGSPEAIARKVLKDAHGNLGKAIRRITFYVNRAGENCSPEARKAKKILTDRKARQE